MSWDKLHRIVKGQIAECYAKIEFLKREFEVYSTDADNVGVDFIAIDNNKKVYKIQVKSCTNNNYQFIKEKLFYKDENYYVCYIRFIEKEDIEIYLIPPSAWNEGNDAFNYRMYEDKKSESEYGINYSEKNRVYFEKYRIEKVLNDLCKGICDNHIC